MKALSIRRCGVIGAHLGGTAGGIYGLAFYDGAVAVLLAFELGLPLGAIFMIAAALINAARRRCTGARA